MPEPVTTVGLGAIAAYLGKDGLGKLLGPTAEYMGAGLRDLTQKRSEALGRIFLNASRKLGDSIDKPGGVPPKVLKQIVENGSFADDAVELDYLGGVLACSRSETSRDNRGAVIAKQVDSLSNYQIRSHYHIYCTIRSVFQNHGIVPDMDGRPRLIVFMPLEFFAETMDFANSERMNANNLIPHIFFGLNKDGLIGSFQYGEKNGLKQRYPNIDQDGIICEPSASGIELFLWAFGKGFSDLEFLFSPELIDAIDGVPRGIPGSYPAYAGPVPGTPEFRGHNS